ncbi:DUF7671 family protein [Furfurilactobacillus sp. WILCCON 0119]
MKGKYEVHRYLGVPVTTNATGQYVPSGDAQPHNWRTGKHTRGKFTGLGQLFLTENNLMVAVVAVYPVAFKDRHEWTPLQRFTSEAIPETLVATLREQNDIMDGQK